MKNILLITADQWRGDCLGAAGHPLVKTPHLDDLALNGVRFSRHYAGAAPCSPARACLYTGLYQMNNRVCGNGSPLDKRHDTLALAARRAGYEPTVFGYTDQSVDPRGVDGNDPALRTYEQILPGFTPRVWLADDHAVWLSWLERKGYSPEQLNADEIHYPVDGVSDVPRQSPPVYAAEHTPTAFLTDEFIGWSGEQTHRKKPTGAGWFAHISFIRPHPPFCVPEPYNSMYSADAVADFAGEKNWKKIAEQHPYLAFEFSRIAKSGFIPGVSGLVRDWDQNALKTIAAIYYGMITEVDAQIGRIVAELKRSGDWDNTIVVFTSDHGEMLGDHCLLGKFGFHEQSYHIPLIIRDPELSKAHGFVVTEFTEAVDVFPTIIELMNMKQPAHLDGQSLQPALQGETLKHWRDCAHWEFDFRHLAKQTAEKHFDLPSELCNLAVIRSDQYKYVHFAALPPVLFDLSKDPDETTNVAEQVSYQSVRLSMAEQLLSWRAEHLDQSLAFTLLTDDGVVSL